MGIRDLGLTSSVLAILVLPSLTTAEEATHPICPLVVHQERVDSEELELAVDLAVARSSAAEAIFSLVDRLWESQTVERLIYLAAKHERDVAEIEVKRQRLLLKRQEAEAEQFTIVCSPSGSGESAADRSARLDAARRRYRQADCHRIGKGLAIAEVNLAYRSELLKSVRDLRENDVVTQQDVIRAEREVELAQIRVDHQRRRVDACVRSGAASGLPPSGKHPLWEASLHTILCSDKISQGPVAITEPLSNSHNT